MKTNKKLDSIPEAIRYLYLALIFVVGLFTITATGGGGGDDSSGSSSGTGFLSEARVTVLSTATLTGIQGAQVEGIFLDKDTNSIEASSCGTDASGRCIVAVQITGQLADEVTLTVTQTDFYSATTKVTLDSTGSIDVIVYMTPR